MKTLILYYSLDGNTKFIAENMAKYLNANIEEIKTKQDLVNKNSLMKYLWGGRMVMMKEVPEILPINSKLDDYDNIVIGTPVWAWSYTPPIQALFDKYTIKGKKIALFCCHGGGPGKTLEKMKSNLSQNQIIGEIDFREPLKNNKDAYLEKLNKWLEIIKNTFDN